LGQCIQAIEAHRATIEGCVVRFPDIPDLGNLLRAMTVAQRLPRPALAPADKSTMRQALLARYRERQSRNPAPRRTAPWLRVAAALGIVCLILIMSGTGLVRASSDAVPGDGLYGLKRLVEQVELSGADVQTRPETLYRIALTRIDELNTLSERRRKLTEGALHDLSQSVRLALVLQPDKAKRATLINTAETALTRAESTGTLTAMRHAEILQTLSTLPETTATQTTPGSLTPVPTASATLNPTATRTLSPTPTSTGTPTPTLTPTETPTETLSPTPTSTETPTPTETMTATPGESPTLNATSMPKSAATDKAKPTRKPTKASPAQGTPKGGKK
jgi:hypothetical protein